MLTENYTALKNEIMLALKEAKRASNACELIAVSKTVETEKIAEVAKLGQIHFGENYVQEAESKWVTLKQDFPHTKLHMIGALQSNKAKEAVALFDVIHTLDRESLASALSKEIEKQGKSPKLFIQINTGEEPQKGGVLPLDADKFILKCKDKFMLSVEGLMCIPPDDKDPAPHFALLNFIAKKHGLNTLSMGMSADYKSAINMGATFIRVGSALFGARARKV